MKKITYITAILGLSFIFISACSPENQKITEQKQKEETEQPEQETKSHQPPGLKTEISDESLKELTEDKLKEVFNDNIGSTDEIESIKHENNNISASIRLGEIEKNVVTSEIDSAVARYSTISDDLLNYDSWDTLNIEFINVGNIKMDKNQSEKNELDAPYFPIEKIQKQLDTIVKDKNGKVVEPISGNKDNLGH